VQPALTPRFVRSFVHIRVKQVDRPQLNTSEIQDDESMNYSVFRVASGRLLEEVQLTPGGPGPHAGTVTTQHVHGANDQRQMTSDMKIAGVPKGA